MAMQDLWLHGLGLDDTQMWIFIGSRCTGYTARALPGVGPVAQANMAKLLFEQSGPEQ